MHWRLSGSLVLFVGQINGFRSSSHFPGRGTAEIRASFSFSSPKRRDPAGAFRLHFIQRLLTGSKDLLWRPIAWCILQRLIFWVWSSLFFNELLCLVFIRVFLKSESRGQSRLTQRTSSCKSLSYRVPFWTTLAGGK